MVWITDQSLPMGAMLRGVVAVGVDIILGVMVVGKSQSSGSNWDCAILEMGGPPPSPPHPTSGWVGGVQWCWLNGWSDDIDVSQ